MRGSTWSSPNATALSPPSRSLSAIGWLNEDRLKLPVERYDPVEHYGRGGATSGMVGSRLTADRGAAGRSKPVVNVKIGFSFH